MFSKEIFAERLGFLRKNAGITQSALAAAIGINRTAITLMESGERAASIEVLCALADYFDVSLDFLTGRTDNPNSHKE